MDNQLTRSDFVAALLRDLPGLADMFFRREEAKRVRKVATGFGEAKEKPLSRNHYSGKLCLGILERERW